jgi:hypothetical protein
MVLAPESLAVTLTGSKFVGHVVSSLLKFIGENRSRPNRGQQVCEKWTLTERPLAAFPAFPDSSKNSLLGAIHFPAPKLREIGSKCLDLSRK